MGNFSFSSKDGYCPQCIAFGKRWYIQDKAIGGDRYEYALMSKPIVEGEALKFKDKRQLVEWIYGVDEVQRFGVVILLLQSTMRDFDFEDVCMIKKKEKRYVLSKKDLILHEYIEPTQETGWCEKYIECLEMAKEILTEVEKQVNGEQITLF